MGGLQLTGVGAAVFGLFATFSSEIAIFHKINYL